MNPAAATPEPATTPLRVAYLVNHYPAPSHSFIRREILALETLGCQVSRFSIRKGQVPSQGSADAVELERTHALLGNGLLRKLQCLLLGTMTLLTRPRRALTALALTIRIGWRSDRGLLRHFAYFLEAAVLLRALGRDVELVHAHFGTNSAAVAMLCGELGGPPFSFTVHGPEEFERALGISLREKVARASFVAVISDFCRSQLLRVSRFEDWGKATLVRCGVDADFLTPARVAAPPTPDLLWVGRLAPEKGIPVLLEACRHLQGRGVPFRLTLVGGGDLETWVRTEIAAAGLTGQIVMAGWQSAAQIRDHMDRTRGLIVASFAEGLPVVIMEALARERPVVATRIAAIPELVLPDVSGWLVAAGRADLLADAMETLLRCPADRLAQLGRAGRKQVELAHDALREGAAMLAAMRRATSRPATR